MRRGAEAAREVQPFSRRSKVVLAWLVGSYIQDVRIPGALPTLGAAAILVASAVLASLIPAARASRVDVMQALRSE